MTNMGAFRERGITIVRGEGSTVWDDAGNALIDVSAALWYCNIGYGRAELADAAAAQMRELASYKTYDGFTSPQTEELAARVAGLVPLDGAKVFFTSGGGESIDTAAKLSRAYWTAVGKPDKHVIFSRQFAYHGSNAYGTSLGGMAALDRGLRAARLRGRPGAVGRRRGARGGDRPRRLRPRLPRSSPSR